MKLGDKLIVDIIDEDNIGNGIAKINNIVIFVKYALLNEKIEVELIDIKKRYYIAKIINIIKSSDKRINVICPNYDKCGGCNFLHTTYSNERDIKLKYLESLFNTKINYLNTNNELNYRNKVVLHVLKGKLGFFNDKTHELCNLDSCYLLNPKINSKISELNNLDLNNITDIMIRCINNKIMININGNIEYFNIDCDSLYINNKYIKGEEYLIDKIDNYKFSIYPESFYQVNKEGMINVYNEAKKYIDKNESLLDLYCGTGTIGIWNSSNNKSVTGIEINKSSIENAKINLKLNNIKNIKYICEDASNVKGLFDVIVVDPPRSGLASKKIINYLNNSNTKKIVYISCNPNTLKRDVDNLTNYKLVHLSCADMFPRTKHIECICVLERKN